MWLNMPGIELENIPVIFPNFQKCTCCEKYLKDNIHNSLHLARECINNSRHLARKYARRFDGLDICAWTLSIPQNSQFSFSYALGELFASRNRWCPLTNIRAYFRNKSSEAIVYIWLCKFKVTIITNLKICNISQEIYR